jgi:hypothetical protein
MNLIFCLKDLYINKDYSISKQVEQVLVENFKILYNLEEKDVEFSQGCDASFDFRLKDLLFELKIMSSLLYSIEISRANGDPSGITSSKADYYIIINPGKLYSQEVMKIRIMSRRKLSHLASEKKTDSKNIKIYQPNAVNSLGSICINVNPKEVTHDFIGYFAIAEKIGADYYVDFAKPIFFDTDRFCSLFVGEILKTK